MSSDAGSSPSSVSSDDESLLSPTLSSDSEDGLAPRPNLLAEHLDDRSAQSTRRFKLHLAILRGRQALQSRQTGSYHALATALSSISASLPTSLSSLGSALPILDRLVTDTVQHLEQLDKAGRAEMTKDEAKEMVILRQKLRKALKPQSDSKGKRKESTRDTLRWTYEVRELVGHIARNRPRPACMAAPHDAPTTALLSSMESLLLPCTVPRVSLSRAGLTNSYIEEWPLLYSISDALDWYLSFDPQASSTLAERSRTLLDRVRSLDLSKNRLSYFPRCFTTLFPNIEILSLSHNHFSSLPSYTVQFHNLRTLKLRVNPLFHTATPPPDVDTYLPPLPFIPPLLHFALGVLLPLRSQVAVLPIPAAIQQLISTSYRCQSCQLLITPSSPYFHPPIFESILLLEVGVTVPRSSSSASSLSSLSRSPSPTPTARLTFEQRVLLSLQNSGKAEELDNTTYVIGPTRLCRACIGPHFAGAVNTEGVFWRMREEEVVQGVCGCEVCVEERKVRDGTEERVLRWLRRKHSAAR